METGPTMQKGQKKEKKRKKSKLAFVMVTGLMSKRSQVQLQQVHIKCPYDRFGGTAPLSFFKYNNLPVTN